MGTQQELTTEQISLLLMIKMVEDFEKENPNNIPDGGVKEVLDSNDLVKPEDFDRIAKVLEYYGYLRNGDELTIDGRQYIELFTEYLEEKTSNPIVVHNSFTLVNLEKLDFSIDACLFKCGIAEGLTDISKTIKVAMQAIKNALHK